MKTPKSAGKAGSAKKRSLASGGDAGARASSGKKKSSAPKRDSADDDWGADGDDGSMFMPVPSFEGGGELDLGGAGPAWETYDWQGETSARQRKKAKSAAAAAAARSADPTDANADPAARPGDAESQTKKKKRDKPARADDRAPAAPVVNRAKPPKPEKKVKVDMRFGSEWDKKRLRDKQFEERREAKRQKYAAMRDAVAEVEGGEDGDDAPEAEAKVSGKILGRRRRAAEKRARAAEARRAERVAKGLPVDRAVKTLPAKLAVGTAAGVNALEGRSKSTGGGGGSDAAPATSAKAEKNARRKARREKKAAEDAREAATPGGKTQKSSGGKEETPKERARREKREAAEELERRAAELRAAAEEDDSEEEEDEEEEEGDWGEQFSSDEDDDEDDEDGNEDEDGDEDDEDDDVSFDEDEDAALDAALAASSDEEEEEDDDDEDDDEVEPESESESESEEAPAPAPVAAAKPGKMSLVDKMRAKLSGGQFRMLNETLYTTTGDAALKMVRESPGVFDAYHQGFREQTKEWPTRPVDACLEWLATQPASLTVADFGCGDAELARRATQKKVHSFDLESNTPGVTACNMASTPLKDASVDVAVFSLALMGTDYGTFLEEAHRVRPLASRVSPVPRVGNRIATRRFLSRDFFFQGRAQSSRARPSMTGAYYSRAPKQTDDGLPFHRRVISP